MKIIEYRNYGEHYTIYEKDKIMEIELPNKTTTLSFERLNEIVNDTKNVNRIYKPISLLFYIDYKSHKLKNWNNVKEYELKEII